MKLLSQPESENGTDGGEVRNKLETGKFWGFKVKILQIYHWNPRISQYTKWNLRINTK